MVREGLWTVTNRSRSMEKLPGGGGYSPHILVGMCRGKVKMGPGSGTSSRVERENAGLRNELEPF